MTDRNCDSCCCCCCCWCRIAILLRQPTVAVVDVAASDELAFVFVERQRRWRATLSAFERVATKWPRLQCVQRDARGWKVNTNVGYYSIQRCLWLVTEIALYAVYSRTNCNSFERVSVVLHASRRRRKRPHAHVFCRRLWGLTLKQISTAD